MTPTQQLITDAYDALQEVINTHDDLGSESVAFINFNQGVLAALRDVVAAGGVVPESVLATWTHAAQEALYAFTPEDEEDSNA